MLVTPNGDLVNEKTGVSVLGSHYPGCSLYYVKVSGRVCMV